MKRRTARKIKQLKNKSVWPHIIVFIISLVIGTGLMGVIFMVMVTSILQNKVSDSLRNAYHVQEYIDEQLESGASYEDILVEIEQMANCPLAVDVIDNDGNVIEMYGEEIDLGIDDKTMGQFIGMYYVSDASGESDLVKELDGKKAAKDIFVGVLSVMKEYNAKQYVLKDIYSYEFWLNPELPSDVQHMVEQQFTDSFSEPIISFELYESDDFDRFDDDDEEDDEIDTDDASDITDGLIEEDSDALHVYMKYRQHIYIDDIILVIAIEVISFFVFILIVIFQFATAIGNIVYQRSILRLLLRDQVTDGNSMLAFEQFAGRSLRRRKRKSMAMVEFSLLRYKNYCTLYGLEQGERLLTVIDRMLSKNLGYGEMVARTADANFAILLVNKKMQNYETESIDRIKHIIDELPEMLKKTRGFGGPLQGLSNIAFNAGLYVMGPALNREGRLKRIDRSNNIEQLRMKADIAKQSLGNEAGVTLYNHKMWEDELWAQKVEDMMQAALDNQEFQVYVQPKYHPSTEELMGGEALVRWISPTEGFISPGQFIPIFEKNGFITKLDDYMITHTAELQAKWLAAGKKIVPVSVNVSRLHFSQPDLAEHINSLVDKYELPHKYIEIELTESAFFDDKKALLTTVRKLQEFGFAVSMDDFGAGYSSLNSLKDLPLNVLKLDAEFFRGEDFGGRGEIVVSEAIALAKMLNMKIVAEGVEKKEQVDFLAKQKCDMIQGYYFAKPMPADEYETRMSEIVNVANDEAAQPTVNLEKPVVEEAVIVESVSEETATEEKTTEEAVAEEATTETPVAVTVTEETVTEENSTEEPAGTES